MQNIKFIPFKFPGIPNIQCIFSTRFPLANTTSGNLAQEAESLNGPARINREYILKHFALHSCKEVKQVHGTKILLEPENDPNFQTNLPLADALATNSRKTGLLIKIADCQPILIAHNSGQYIAALHVGWKANRKNTIKLWITKFCSKYDLKPENVLAVRGPSLGPDRSEFINFNQEWGPEFKKYFDPTQKTVNMWQLTRDQLLNAGLISSNIFSLDLCTYSHPDLFYSYRRDKTRYRQGAFIWKN